MTIRQSTVVKVICDLCRKSCEIENKLANTVRQIGWSVDEAMDYTNHYCPECQDEINNRKIYKLHEALLELSFKEFGVLREIIAAKPGPYGVLRTTEYDFFKNENYYNLRLTRKGKAD